MIEVRTTSAAVEHRGVQLTAAHTMVALETRWVRVGVGYRRPTQVIDANGVATAILDHSMIARALAVLLTLVLVMKGRKP